MKSTLTRLVLAGAVAAALLPSAIASAADGKNIQGSICSPQRGADNLEGQAFTRDLSGLTNNQATGTPARFVYCPLVRDNNANTDGLPALKVLVKANGVGVRCAAIARNTSGATVKSVFVTSAAVTGLTTIDFGNTFNASASGGHYAIQCELPPKSSIVSISYDEP